MAGAPTVRTKANERVILDAVRLGLSFKDACRAAGISQSTFTDWKANDSAFMARINEAEAEGKAERLARISRHAAKDWKADAWILSHRYPDDFSEKRIIEANSGTDPFTIMVQMYDDEEQAQQGDTPANEGDSE